MNAFHRLSTVLTVAALTALWATPAGAQVFYVVTVNTSAVNGTSGNLDFQFNPGNGTSQPATAQILIFNGGMLTGVPQMTGSVAGALPGTVTLMNSTALNELFQGFNYGSQFSFVLELSGPAVESPNGTATAGSTFGLGLYDNGQPQQPILTNQGANTGFAGQVDINVDGSTTATSYPTATNGPPVVTFTPLILTPPVISKSFADPQIDLFFGSTPLSFTITNPAANLIPLTGISFTDLLPAGLLVSVPSNGLVGSCDGGTITAATGSNSISLSGATLAAGDSCIFSVQVSGTGIGVLNNVTSTITAGPGRLVGPPAMATLSVVALVFLWFFLAGDGGSVP